MEKIKNNFFKMYGYMFTAKEINFMKSADFRRIGNDLYIYDPQSVLMITLGNMGDGWVCVMEDYFK